MTLTKERKGEIALLFLRAKLAKEEIRLGSNLRRELIQAAKALAVDPNEVLELVREEAHTLWCKTFAPYND